MTAPNPMATSFSDPPRPVSKAKYCIAGILTTVYGLQELEADIHEVACLWLLHPRLQTQECMEPLASSTTYKWHERLLQLRKSDRKTGLIAVSFDQRNHGSREIDKIANEAWRSGNKSHAQDMFSIYHGTSLDTSQILTYLPSYIFPTSSHVITNNVVLGVSLGGHAAWHCLLHDPRITSAIVIIGCPDYIRLMADRARLSRLETWNKSSPPGKDFLGSQDFPKALIETVEKYDPAGLLLGEIASRSDEEYDRDPTDDERTRLMPLMKSALQGKKILNMAGGADKLVPYKCSEPFMRWLKKATGPGGWFQDGGAIVEDVVFDSVGHEMSPSMVSKAQRFVFDILDSSSSEEITRESKI